MTFYDSHGLDIEAEAKRGVLQDSQFVYNGNPRLIPRIRSEEQDSTTSPDNLVLPRNQIDITNPLPVENVTRSKYTPSSIFAQLVQQCWLLVLFRLPALYHSRMLQIGVHSDIGSADHHLMSTTFSALWRHELPSSPMDIKNNVVEVSPQLMQFKASWEVLVDDLLQEWKMFNIISALVQTSVPVLLSLDSQTGSDPVTKTGVLLSFICAGISLLCGSFCVLQFGSMRKMPKAAEWMREARKSDQLLWWNCWIVLSMPAAWLAWSICLLLATMMSYTWRSNAQNGLFSIEISAHAILSLRITVSVVLAFGVLCVGALALTLHLRFGNSLDRKFVFRALNVPVRTRPQEFAGESEQPKSSRHLAFPVFTSHSHEQLPPASMSSSHMPFPTTRLMDTNSISALSPQLPRYVQYQAQKFAPWNLFTTEIQRAFQNPSSPNVEDDVFACIKHWNDHVFKPNGLEVILCQEFPIESVSNEGTYSIYVMDLARANADGRQRLVDIFGPLPASLRKICLINMMSPSVSRKQGYPLGLTLEREPGPTDNARDVTQISEPIVESPPRQDSSVPQAGPNNRNIQSAQSTGRPVASTHPTPRQGSRTYSAPQVVANTRSPGTSNTTTAHNRTRKRTESSQRNGRLR